jgi:hypothetical protein
MFPMLPLKSNGPFIIAIISYFKKLIKTQNYNTKYWKSRIMMKQLEALEANFKKYLLKLKKTMKRP